MTHHGAQLAHVAGPGMGLERADRGLGDRLALTQRVGEVVGEQRDVALALAERRDPDHTVLDQAIVEFYGSLFSTEDSFVWLQLVEWLHELGDQENIISHQFLFRTN